MKIIEMHSKLSRIISCCITLVVVAPSALHAALITGFESDIVGLAPSSPASVVAGNVTVQSSAGFIGTSISVPEGSNFAYLTTGPGATGAGSSGRDEGGASGNENDAAIMTVSFSATQQSILSYQYQTLTAEIDGGFVDSDVFSVNLLSSAGVSSDIGFGTPLSLGGTLVTGPDGSSFDNGLFFPIFGKSSSLIGPGDYTMEFYVGDNVDDLGDTALLIDNIELTPVEQITLQEGLLTGFEGVDVGLPPVNLVSAIQGNVTVETASGFTGGVVEATEGSQFAYLTTGPGPTGAGTGDRDINQVLGRESDVASMEVTFEVLADGSAVFVDILQLSSELGIDPFVPFDAFAVLLDGQPLTSGNPFFVPGDPIVGPDGSVFENGAFLPSTLKAFDLSVGEHSLLFYVGDEVDDTKDSALIVDNIRLFTPVNPVPVPAAVWLFGTALIGLVGFGKRRKTA